jgi:hypothetical protein
LSAFARVFDHLLGRNWSGGKNRNQQGRCAQSVYFYFVHFGLHLE